MSQTSTFQFNRRVFSYQSTAGGGEYNCLPDVHHLTFMQMLISLAGDIKGESSSSLHPSREH